MNLESRVPYVFRNAKIIHGIARREIGEGGRGQMFTPTLGQWVVFGSCTVQFKCDQRIDDPIMKENNPWKIKRFLVEYI